MNLRCCDSCSRRFKELNRIEIGKQNTEWYVCADCYTDVVPRIPYPVRGRMIPTTCARCGATDRALIMSVFNTDVICLDCKDKERLHPAYRAAADAEIAAVKAGDYNFPGVGKPVDL
jgi:hypothetical protein